MRRPSLFLLLPGLLLCLGVAPAWAEEVAYEYECISGKLQATRGQRFNVNVVPRDDEDSDSDPRLVEVEEAEIVRPASPGPFGNPVLILASGSGPARQAMPFQLDTFPTSDNAVEAYARLEFFVVGESCEVIGAAAVSEKDVHACLKERRIPPAVAVFRVGSDNMVNDGTNAALNMDCVLEDIEEPDPPE